MSQELEIEIDAAGKLTVRTRGIKGKSCMQWGDLLAELIGREESRVRTSEFDEPSEPAAVREENRHAVRNLRL